MSQNLVADADSTRNQPAVVRSKTRIEFLYTHEDIISLMVGRSVTGVLTSA